MRSALPPLDLHAHIDVSVPAHDLRGLGAVIFAATRSLEEAKIAVERQDETIVWGVGSHPSLARSHNRFDEATFRQLIERTAFVSEFGLDGKAKVDLQRQLKTLRCVLDVLKDTPRITSLHSYAASEALISELEQRHLRGIVLHWWLGRSETTARAAALGCYFSLNAASVRQSALLESIPLDRILTETDHPFGDRTSNKPQLPGNVATVEEALARHHKLQPAQIRRQMWINLARLVKQAGCAGMLSKRIRMYLATVPVD